MRKLATIQTISDIQPIEGADAIEVASVLGWKVVVKKGQFKIGDKCIYFEIDSLLPEKPEFEHLRKNCWKEDFKGFRIKTIRLRGQISQGFIMPFEDLSITHDEIKKWIKDNLTYKLAYSIIKNWIKRVIFRKKIHPFTDLPNDTDLTSLIGVRKWELPEVNSHGANLSSIKNSTFHPSVPKTDETRIQSIYNKIIDNWRGKSFYVAVKLDGTSFTIVKENGEITLYGRNYKVGDDTEYANCFKKLNIEDKLKKLDNIALQGEMVGPKINGNRQKLKEVDYYIYNIYDLNQNKYLNFNDFKSMINKIGLKSVPILNENFVLNHTIEQLLELANGDCIINPGNIREGIVIRPLIETYEPKLSSRMSFKVISNDFLLKYDQ